MTAATIVRDEIETAAAEILAEIPFVDLHTHLFAPEFGSLNPSGIDEILTYHYLEAELFRSSAITPAQYWELDKPARADLIWTTLFLENTPVSEAARGVLAILQALGLDLPGSSLAPLREFFREQRMAEYIPRILRLSGVSDVVMTNDPLDPEESGLWERGIRPSPEFHAALRLDRILNEWTSHVALLQGRGYRVEESGGGQTAAEVRRFLDDWTARMQPLYMAVSLPDSFVFPSEDIRTRLLREAVLPACRERNMPLALMIGVRRRVNPALRFAGDAVGRADLRCLENLCSAWPVNRFLVSVLSRENQHELCVYARKFANLLPFGCWWFLNNPSIVEEITRERLEMLGTTFVPQHSDARVLEHLIYKWRNTRRTMTGVLAGAYRLLVEDGRPVSREDIRRDVTRLFRNNFLEWTGLHHEG